MGIRKSNKDHLREMALALVAVEVAQAHDAESSDGLTFYTRHETKPTFVSLLQFRDGLAAPLGGRARNWNGAFSGRPGLISELAKPLRDRVMHATANTANSWQASLRSWWRLFDRLEAAGKALGLARLDSVRDLTELHASATAGDPSIGRHEFCHFRAVASDARVAMGLSPLLWPAPDVPEPARSLPGQNGISRYWHALKLGWFRALDRWRLVDSMLAGIYSPNVEQPSEIVLYKAATHFRRVLAELEQPLGLPTNALLKERYMGQRLADGVDLADMWDSFFPNATEIRMAFHLCLAGMGWNVQTLLGLPVDVRPQAESRTPFIRSHPGDESKYILTGFKERGKSEHDVHGDWKNDRSPGKIITELVHRTWALRQHLMQELKQAKADLTEARKASTSHADLAKLWRRVTDLQRRTTCVWLYVHKGSVQVLSDKNYKGDTSGRFLEGMADGINLRLPATSHVPVIVASDFRDAFAAYIWRVSGGSVWHVRSALNQRLLRTAAIYINNTAVNEEAARIWTTFTTVLWDQFRANHPLDHTVIAKLSRDGAISDVERQRLDEYRALKKSRIGVGCKDPWNPPPQVDPYFEADGVEKCTAQRCMLCHTHRVITKESFDGLCMRQAELEDLQTTTPVGAFSLGEHDVELTNTRSALLAFPEEEVQERVALWKSRIATGEHRYPKFIGTQKV